MSVSRCEALQIVSDLNIGANYINEDLPDWFLSAIGNGDVIFHFDMRLHKHAVEVNYGTKDHPEWVYGYTGDYIIYRQGYMADISIMPKESFELYWKELTAE